MIDQVFSNWDETHTRDYGKKLVHIQHRLHQSPLFTDAAIERLIENYPREHYDLHTMVSTGHKSESWREGDIGDSTGREVMEAIRNGQIWLNLRKVMKVSEPYAELLERMFDEIEAHVPGLRTYKHNFGFLISSPKAQVFYHADIPGQSLWQIRGQKRVYLYPNVTPFLPQEGLEAIVLNEADEQDLPYHADYDEQAAVIDLQPGEMLHWPLNAPHRVVNLDTLNMSITTEHYTTEIRNTYVVNYANGILRRRFGMQDLSQSTSGPAFLAKMGLAAAYKYSGVQKQKRF
ncbi:MAG: cupin-like domain-containing protein, partial [Halocynthiibacter sp.]